MFYSTLNSALYYLFYSIFHFIFYSIYISILFYSIFNVLFIFHSTCVEYLRRAEGRADVVLEALRHRNPRKKR